MERCIKVYLRVKGKTRPPARRAGASSEKGKKKWRPHIEISHISDSFRSYEQRVECQHNQNKHKQNQNTLFTLFYKYIDVYLLFHVKMAAVERVNQSKILYLTINNHLGNNR